MILVALFLLLVLAGLRFWGADFLLAHVHGSYGEFTVHAIGVAFCVALALFVDQLVRIFYWELYLHRTRNRPTPALLRDLLTIAILLVGASIGLAVEEKFDFAWLITASGATAVALGIALQAAIQDLFSGIAIHTDSSYAIGDWLTVYTDQMPEPQYGHVTGISWRSTFLALEDGRTLMVPNHVMTANPVLNHSRPAKPKRLFVTIAIDNRISSDRVMDLMLGETFKMARTHGLARHPNPEVTLQKIDADAAIYEVRFYFWPHLMSPSRAQSIVLQAVQQVVQKNGIPLAVSQVELTKPPDVDYILGEEEKRSALGGAPLFANALNADQLDQLSRSCMASELPRGAVLMRQGDPPSNMYVMLEGAVSITIAGEGDQAQEVAVSAAGDIVGEMSLMTGANRTATATAVTRVRVLELKKSDIEGLLSANPGLADRFAHTLAQRQQELDEAQHRSRRKESEAPDILERMRAFFSRAFA